MREFEKSQGKAVEVNVNSKEENSKDFCLDFVQEFGLSSHFLLNWFVEFATFPPKTRFCLRSLWMLAITLDKETGEVQVKSPLYFF